jgi:Zn-dependent peptidase ImmA (M78 family)
MLDDLDSGRDIARHTQKLLRQAEVRDQLPTPVSQIVAAAELSEPAQSLLSESALADVPDYLAKKMRRLRGKAHALLDRKTREIHVSPDVEHGPQRRFKRLHEVTHDILPWQKDTGYADDNFTLSWHTHALFEQEANQGGAELLFQRELFATMAADYRIGFGAILDLAKMFEASYHASFRRYIETHRAPMAGLVLERSPCQRSPLGYQRKEAVNSRSWAERYERPFTWPKLIAGPPYTFVNVLPTLGDEPMRSALTYPDLNNEPTTLQVEIWSNTYRVFVLMWVAQRERLKRKTVVVPGARTA